jgi:hypothetical protein
MEAVESGRLHFLRKKQALTKKAASFGHRSRSGWWKSRPRNRPHLTEVKLANMKCR